MPAWRKLANAAGAALVILLAPGPLLAHGDAAPAPTLSTLAGTWLLDPLPWIGSALAVAAYLVAVRRVNHRHPRNPVPPWRVAAWLAGVVIGLVALVSAIDVYADDLLSVHMVQHILLTMLVPPLLALAAPITLLLRVSSPRTRQRWLLPALHSRALRVAASPIVAWAAFTAVLLATHFTPLYDAALENPTIHVAEHALFLVSGVLFWWPVIAADPGPRRMGYGPRVVYLLAQMPVGAAVGLTIYFATDVLYSHYATLERTWGPTPLEDQQIAGVLMWGAGNVAMLAAIAAVVAAGIRAEMRRSARLERRAARASEG